MGLRILLLAAAITLVACRGHAPSSVVAEVPPERVVRLTRSLSLAGISWLIELEERNSRVRGAMRITASQENRRLLERRYGCRTDRSNEDSFVCVVPFRRGAPDWAAVLTRLTALDVANPPSRHPSRTSVAGVGRAEYVCSDGTPWSLELQMPDGGITRDRQGCGPMSLERQRYEAAVDSILDSIEQAARVR